MITMIVFNTNAILLIVTALDEDFEDNDQEEDTNFDDDEKLGRWWKIMMMMKWPEIQATRRQGSLGHLQRGLPWFANNYSYYSNSTVFTKSTRTN